jgi:hypothetical protein
MPSLVCELGLTGQTVPDSESELSNIDYRNKHGIRSVTVHHESLGPPPSQCQPLAPPDPTELSNRFQFRPLFASNPDPLVMACAGSP